MWRVNRLPEFFLQLMEYSVYHSLFIFSRSSGCGPSSLMEGTLEMVRCDDFDYYALTSSCSYLHLIEFFVDNNAALCRRLASLTHTV